MIFSYIWGVNPLVLSSWLGNNEIGATLEMTSLILEEALGRLKVTILEAIMSHKDNKQQ